MPINASLLVAVNGITPQVLRKTSENRTHSALYWEGTGPLVICLHGFPDSINTFQYMVPVLIKAGYRVLVPVMPGYEPASVDPAGRYYITDLAQDAVGWIDRLGEEAAHIIGHDWGAIAAWMAIAMYPHRFFSMTSLGIPPLRRLGRALVRCPSQLLKSWYIGLFQLPLLPEQLLTAGNGALVRLLWQRWSPGWKAPRELVQAALDSFSSRPVRSAALGYYRCLGSVLSTRHKQARRALRLPYQVPCLMVTGGRDGCIDSRLFELAIDENDFMAGGELYRLQGAGHFCHLEKPQQVHAKLLKFLDMHPKGAKKLADELARQLG